MLAFQRHQNHTSKGRDVRFATLEVTGGVRMSDHVQRRTTKAPGFPEDIQAQGTSRPSRAPQPSQALQGLVE